MTLCFQSLLTDEQLSNCPVLILGNKIDKPGAASEDELRAYFNLYGQTTGKVNIFNYPYLHVLSVSIYLPKSKKCFVNLCCV